MINDILRRDGAIPAPLIIPVSGLISRNARELESYDRILDSIFRPLMQSLAGNWSFGPRKKYADGIYSNFDFEADSEARHAWRFMDLTAHVVYLSNAIRRTTVEDMRVESHYLQIHAKARAAIKDIVEMQDAQADRLIRSWESTKGHLSNVLATEIPVLASDGIWAAIHQVLTATFDIKTPGPRPGHEPGAQAPTV